MNKRLLALAAALSVSMPMVASAKPVRGTCTAATPMTTFVGYLDCKGAFRGNINGNAAELTALNGFGGLWAGSWVWQGKSDNAGNGPFSGGPGATSINFDGSISGKFVIGIKQASYYSYYLFNETVPISSINWSSVGTAPNNPGVSHIALYTLTSQPFTTSAVPEPSTYALMASGLLALGVVARRRRKS